nr:hypothetical protein [Tanacetum cinerariifolium]
FYLLESNSLKDNIISELPSCSEVTPNEPVDSLNMGDEHLDTVPATESDELIKSSVENLVPNPSESEGENGCDVPSCFTTFSNILFDDEYEFDSVDNQPLHNEEFPKEIFLNPLFEEKINSMRIDQHHFNAESDLVESMLNRDSSIISSSSKIDSLLDEFAGELTLLKSIPPGIDETCYDEFIKSCVENLVPNPSESKSESECDMHAREEFTTFSNILFNVDYEFDPSDDHITITLTHDSSLIISSKIDSLLDEFTGELTVLKSIPSGIDKTDCHPENEIHLTKRLLYDNSSPRPSEEFVSESSNADIKSFSPSPIPVKDNDSFMEKINLTFTPDDLMPPSINDDDNDSERYVLILEELPINYSLSLPVNESFYFDIPLFFRPPTKPPDGNIGILNIKIIGDISEQKVPIANLTITRVLKQEKSPDLLSHRGLKFFYLSSTCPMMIHGRNIPVLDVPLFYFYPLNQFKYGGNWVKLSDLKQALRGRHPMLISSLVFLFIS